MSETGKDVLLVSFPHQLLHAVSSLRFHRARHGRAPTDRATVVVWAYQRGEHCHNSRFRRMFSQLLQGLPWIELVFPGYLARRIWMSPQLSLASRSRNLDRYLSGADVRDIYYSHDVSVDHTAQVFLQWRPSARAICFGDPPGFLYRTGDIARNDSARGLVGRVLFGRPSLLPESHWRFADSSYVAVDFRSGAGAAGEDWHLVPPDILRSTLDALATGCRAMKESQQRLLHSRSPGQRLVLLVLSNFTESGLTTRASELALYGEIVRTHVRPQDIVLVKPHAGTRPGFLDSLRAALSAYEVQALPEELRWSPLEMLGALLLRAQTISVSSSSALISLLYGNDRVIHGLTDGMIERYFRLDRQESFKASNRSIEQAIARAPLASRPKPDTMPGAGDGQSAEYD